MTNADVKQRLQQRAGLEIELRAADLRGLRVGDIPNDTFIDIPKGDMLVSLSRTRQGRLRISIHHHWNQETWQGKITLREYLEMFKTGLKNRKSKHADVACIACQYDVDGIFTIDYRVFPTELDLLPAYKQALRVHNEITSETSNVLRQVETDIAKSMERVQTSRPDYDVALSFAGENRVYVEEVANILFQLGVKVFYDKYEEVDLWGKNLYIHLDDVYRKKSRYCVIFISKHYKDKLWTNHERESAHARAFQEKGEYILPVRFDKTEIAGVRSTTAYIDLQGMSPADLAYLIAKKLGFNLELEGMTDYLRHYLPDYIITIKGTNLVFESEVEQYRATFPIRLMLEMYKAKMLEEMFLLPGIVPH